MKNWKTTLAGVILAIVQVLLPMLAGGTPMTLGTVLPAVSTAALGMLAKDHDGE